MENQITLNGEKQNRYFHLDGGINLIYPLSVDLKFGQIFPIESLIEFRDEIKKKGEKRMKNEITIKRGKNLFTERFK